MLCSFGDLEMMMSGCTYFLGFVKLIIPESDDDVIKRVKSLILQN